MELIMPEKGDDNTQQYESCYVKAFPLFTTYEIHVSSDECCAITKHTVTINSSYSTVIFFTLDNIISRYPLPLLSLSQGHSAIADAFYQCHNQLWLSSHHQLGALWFSKPWPTRSTFGFLSHNQLGLFVSISQCLVDYLPPWVCLYSNLAPDCIYLVPKNQVEG